MLKKREKNPGFNVNLEFFFANYEIIFSKLAINIL